MIHKRNIETIIFFIVFCSYYLADKLLPFLQVFSSVYVNLTAVVFVSIYLISNKNNYKVLKFFLPFVPILVIEFLRYFSYQEGVKEFFASFYKTLLFAMPAFVAFFLLVNNFKKAILVIIKVSIIFLIITTITSIFGLLIDSNASRTLGSTINEKVLTRYNLMNIGGFGIVYMIPLLIPMLIAMFKKRKIKIITLLLILIIFVYFVYLSQYLLALILLALSFISIVIAYNYTTRKFIFYGITTLLLFLVARPFTGDVFYVFAQHNESKLVSTRLNALGDVMYGISSNEGAYTGRMEMYQTSFDAFISSPIIGVYFTHVKIGEHSFILDKLGLFGIVGFVALILFYRQIYKYLYKPFKKESYYGYMIWSLITSILLAFVNPTPSMFVVCFITPLIGYSLQDKEYFVANRKGILTNTKLINKSN